jgi:hypothetical protein
MTEKKSVFVIPTCPPIILPAKKIPAKQMIDEMREEMRLENEAQINKPSPKKPKNPCKGKKPSHPYTKRPINPKKRGKK